jgi:hypothetical protein
MGMDSTGMTSADWTAADVELVPPPPRGGVTGWQYEVASGQVFPAVAAGAPLDHLGGPNASLTPVELMSFSIE